MTTRAVALVSGGLDSIEAMKLVQNQGIEVLALNFVSCFFSCASAARGHTPSRAARELGAPIRVVPMGMDYMRMLEHPRHGRGRAMNPCIDCHIYMLKRAKQIMEEMGASFVITGEVLGQRPMSQHLTALKLIEKESGLGERLLRPLSARLLRETLPEREGLVDRNLLLDIQGRSRKRQLELAEQMQLKTFSPPAGGCKLTEAVLGRRLDDLFAHLPDYGMIDIRLLTLGRHFRISDKVKAIIGRNEPENERMDRLADHHIGMELADHVGPSMLVRGQPEPSEQETLGRLLRFYAKKATEPETRIKISRDGQESFFGARDPATEAEVARLHI